MLIAVDPVRSLVVNLFVAQGAPPAHAEIVANHLIESSRMGLHSHGLIRVPQYYDAVASGEIDPKAVPRREQLGTAISRIDGQWGFGQVAAHVAADIACELAGANGVSISDAGAVRQARTSTFSNSPQWFTVGRMRYSHERSFVVLGAVNGEPLSCSAYKPYGHF